MGIVGKGLLISILGCVWLLGQTHVIRAGVLIAGRGNVLPNRTIRIEGGKIVSVDGSTERPDIDLSSETVMPGWIGACLPVSDGDSIPNADGKAFRLLNSGFTTVVSQSKRLRDLIDDQRWAGPRVLAHGECSAGERLFEAARNGSRFTPDDLAAVTIKAAEALGIADRTGFVAPGMFADLVATKGNPLEDSAALRAVVFVMKDGHVYREPKGPDRMKLILRN